MNIKKWRIFCNTENDWSGGWLENEPTVCFNNNTHTVNPGSIQILEAVEKIEVKIQREDTPTGGNYNIQGYSMVIAANSTEILPVSWKFPINVLSVHCQSNESNLGDTLNAITRPQTLVGVNTVELLQGETTVSVNSTVIENCKIGYNIYIADESLGRVTSIDTLNSTVTSENTSLITHTVGSYIYLDLRIIRDFNLGYSNGNDFGAFNGNKYLEPNVVTNVIYTNNSIIEKTFSFSIEYLF
jgi:hypothetical protein